MRVKLLPSARSGDKTESWRSLAARTRKESSQTLTAVFRSWEIGFSKLRDFSKSNFHGGRVARKSGERSLRWCSKPGKWSRQTVNGAWRCLKTLLPPSHRVISSIATKKGETRCTKMETIDRLVLKIYIQHFYISVLSTNVFLYLYETLFTNASRMFVRSIIRTGLKLKLCEALTRTVNKIINNESSTGN